MGLIANQMALELFFKIKERIKEKKPKDESGKREYKVDYHGQMNRFDGAKEKYAEGTEVEISYSLIASDTDYTFYVDGHEVRAEWNDKRGYIIRFTMPDHDIELYCVDQNSMKI